MPGLEGCDGANFRGGEREAAAVGSGWFSLRAEDDAEEDDDGARWAEWMPAKDWGFKISRAVETGVPPTWVVEIEGLKE
ncbi:hypothetical protein V496_06965 [Pseudogymnoascus sp. VKM F-4515 (FW-2607)]|nr:hypothetical protein V496_06965 [Pseudogymnoascus sp. VKM F-4515 (FW-2607)]KFY69346.1 hypothetical protein V498_10485 [Pseudogymnoascus sp. VKM F-4517 (FW-2822)]